MYSKKSWVHALIYIFNLNFFLFFYNLIIIDINIIQKL